MIDFAQKPDFSNRLDPAAAEWDWEQDQKRRARAAAEKKTTRKAKPGADRWHELNGFVDEMLRTVSPTDGAVWFVLFRHARNGFVSVSQERIAEAAGLAERTVRKSLQSLRRAGLIEIEKHARNVGKRQNANRYRMVRN